MAYIVDRVDDIEGSTSFSIAPISGYQADDYAFILMRTRQFTSDNATITGFTRFLSQIDSDGRTVGFYKKLTASEANFSVSDAGNTTNVYSHFLIRDADPTTFLDDDDFTLYTTDVSDFVAPSLTTTTDNCLLISGLGIRSGGDSDTSYLVKESFLGFNKQSFIAEGRAALFVASSAKGSSGATPAVNYYSQTADTGCAFNIAIRNASGGYVERSLIGDVELLDSGIGETYTTAQDLSDLGASIDGTPINSTTVTTSVEQRSLQLYPRFVNSGITNTTQWTGFMIDFDTTSYDFTNKIFYVDLSVVITGRLSGDYYLFLQDSTGNWSRYELYDVATTIEESRVGVYIDESTTAFSSSGTVDFTDINRVALGVVKSGGNTNANEFFAKFFTLINKFTIVGGRPDNPISFVGSENLLTNAYRANMGSVQGEGQTVLFPSLEIGNGTTRTYFNAEVSSLERPASGRNDYQVDPLKTDIIINASADDVINISNSILATSVEQNFEIASTSSTSANYDFSGTALKGWKVVWKTGVAGSGTSFRGCSTVDVKAATFSNCTFRECTGSENYYVTAEDGADITNSTFIKGDETYAIQIAAAGDIDLSGTTFTGYTTEINVTASTGTVNITRAASDAAITANTAGATVNFVSPATTYTLEMPNILDNSRYQIYNETTDTELTNTTVSGGSGISETYDLGTDYSAGDTGRIRVTYVDGVTAKDPIEIQFTFAAATTTNSLPNTQTDFAVYNEIGVDGSAVTKFDANYVDTEVDLVVGSNFTADELFAWYQHNLTSEQGIRLFFGGFIAEDIGNFRAEVTVADVLLDNETATNVHQTDNKRIYRSDGVRPVKDPTTGGGGIDVEWREPVLVSTADLTAQLEVINNGVQKASKIIPHTTDLP